METFNSKKIIREHTKQWWSYEYRGIPPEIEYPYIFIRDPQTGKKQVFFTCRSLSKSIESQASKGHISLFEQHQLIPPMLSPTQKQALCKKGFKPVSWEDLEIGILMNQAPYFHTRLRRESNSNCKRRKKDRYFILTRFKNYLAPQNYIGLALNKSR